MSITIRPSQLAGGFAIAALAIVYPGAPPGLSAGLAWSCLAIGYVCLIGSARTRYLAPHIPCHFGIDTLFLSFYVLLFFVPYQLHVLGLGDYATSVVFSQTFAPWANRAVILSTMGMVAFCIGFAAHQSRPFIPATPRADARVMRHLPLLVFLGMAALLALYHGAGWRGANEGRYTGTSAGGSLAEGVGLLITLLAMIAIATALTRRAQHLPLQAIHWLGLLVAIYWGSRLFAFGDRNAVLLLVLVAAAGWAGFNKRIGRTWLALGLALGLMLYFGIEWWRTDPVAGPRAGESSFNFTTIGLRAALAAVPDLGEFGWGRYKLIGAMGIVPLIRGPFLAETTAAISSADVITLAMLGPNASWSVGSNIVADLYLDFGVAGVPLGLGAIGWFAGWVQARTMASPTSPPTIIFYLVALALLAELPRYSADFPLRFVVWTLFLFALLQLVTPRDRHTVAQGRQGMAR